tara:strand:- start:2280 stop:3641 length:1362 start_codon:yes stop_codon:yes gene_type:complete
MFTDKRHINRILIGFGLLIVLFGLGALATDRLLHAQTNVSTALYTIRATATNDGTTALNDIGVPFAISGGELIAGNFIKTTALNTAVQQGATDIPHMPPTGRIQIEGAVQKVGSVFTEYTSEAQSDTTNDLPLLGTSPSVDDAWFFGCDNPCRIFNQEIDTAGVGTWTIVYEYWNGSEWTALANVEDLTTGFTVLGANSTTWDMPTDWATQTVTGSAVNSYWGRARISAFTSLTTQPLGSRQRYENGQWWTWVETLPVENQEQYTIALGGTTDFTTYHQTFPGTTGIITGDAAGIELGNAYSLAMVGRLDFSNAGASTYVVNKTGAYTINVSGSAVSPTIFTSVTGGATVIGENTGITIPDTGTQTIIMGADGNSAATWVSDGGGMVSYPVQTITNNANNITWTSNSGTNYFDQIRLGVAAATVFNFDDTQAEFAQGTLTNTTAYTAGLGLSN